ncbi:MAG: YCF48-related protein [Oceanococcaceae bacterium]
MKRTLIGLLSAMLPVTGMAVGISDTISPQPAELMPLASHSVLLDVTDTGKRLVAVGERGHVVVSLDGETWIQAPTPVRAYLTAVDFADEMNGMAVGHDSTILRTRDGGRSWVLQNFEPVEVPDMDSDEPFLDVLMLNSRDAFAVGAYSKFYRTRNGGETWEDFDTPIREDGWHFNSIIRLNNGDLFITGEQGTLAVSTDQGETWEALDSPYSSTMFGAAPVGTEGVLICGLRGNVFYSPSPASGEWTQLDTGLRDSLISAEQLPNGEVVMVGINGVVMLTEGGLQRVRQLDNPEGITLAGVQPVKSAVVVVGNAGTQLLANP